MTDVQNGDLEKFAKCFILKSTQIILESRLGGKVSTRSKPNAAAHVKDFYLNSRRLPSLLDEPRKLLEGDDILKSKLPWCVEFSLHADECENMVIETWSFGIIQDMSDSSAGMIQIYDRLAMLLKSLVTITRLLPGYKLSRRQGPESFLLSYRFYIDEPEIHYLGDEVKHIRVGQVATPVGAFRLSVSHRTWIATHPKPKKCDSVILKSDYFSLKCLKPIAQPSVRAERKRNLDLEKSLVLPLASGGIAEDELLKVIPEHGLCRILPKAREKIEEAKMEEMEDSTTSHQAHSPPILECTMLPLECPFSSDDNGKLGHFYREILNAPQLQQFEISHKEPIDIADQINVLENNVKEFEASLISYFKDFNITY